MQLEWDEKKRASNLAKHGIDFIDLKPLFDGRELMQRWIDKHGERRCQLIGRLMGCVLFVVYAERLGRRRIISARLASRKERGIYEKSQHIDSGKNQLEKTEVHD